jgi:hypothetical protein
MRDQTIWSLVAIVVLLCTGGCQRRDNFGQVYAAAKKCSDQRTNALYQRVAAQDVTDEQLHAIVDQCMAEANADANASAAAEDCSEASNWSACYLNQSKRTEEPKG